MEESPTAIDTNRLLRGARELLRAAFAARGETSPSDPFEAAILGTLSHLIQAVERSVGNPQQPFVYCFKAEDEERSELDQLYESITSRLDPTTSTGKRKFVITFPPMELAVDEIWPEGNAPENPTPEDVVEAMKAVQYAHPARVAAEWLLIDKLRVRYHTDKHGEMEVEWDGS
jgi:hypothetical protein